MGTLKSYRRNSPADRVVARRKHIAPPECCQRLAPENEFKRGATSVASRAKNSITHSGAHAANSSSGLNGFSKKANLLQLGWLLAKLRPLADSDKDHRRAGDSI